MGRMRIRRSLAPTDYRANARVQDLSMRSGAVSSTGRGGSRLRAKRSPILGDCARHRSHVNEPEQLIEVDSGQELAALEAHVRQIAKREHLDLAGFPDPHFLDSQLSVDVRHLGQYSRLRIRAVDRAEIAIEPREHFAHGLAAR